MENKRVNPQELHRFYMAHEAEIVNDADAFGTGYAMDKWRMDGGHPMTLITLEKYIRRRKKINERMPYIHKRAMYPDGESYCQGVVKAIITTIEELKNTISNLADQLAGKDAIIAEKDKRIKQLQEEKQSFGALGCQKEETIMQELLRQIK